MVSNTYMTLDALGYPYMPSHQEILEEEQAREDHVIDVFPRCRRIMEILHADIDK